MLDSFEQLEKIGPNKGLDSLMGSKAQAKNEREVNNALGDGMYFFSFVFGTVVRLEICNQPLLTHYRFHFYPH